MRKHIEVKAPLKDWHGDWIEFDPLNSSTLEVNIGGYDGTTTINKAEAKEIVQYLNMWIEDKLF